MAGTGRLMDRDRAASAGLVAGVHALLLYALVAGLGFEAPSLSGDELKLFDVAEAPPPPVEEPLPAADRASGPETQAEDAPEDAPAPPDLRADPTPVVVPPPEVRIVRPSPVVAAPVAVGSSRVDLQACKLEYSIVSPK